MVKLRPFESLVSKSLEHFYHFRDDLRQGYPLYDVANQPKILIAVGIAIIIIAAVKYAHVST